MRHQWDRVTRARRAWDVGASAHDAGGRIEALQRRKLWTTAVRSLDLRPDVSRIGISCSSS